MVSDSRPRGMLIVIHGRISSLIPSGSTTLAHTCPMGAPTTELRSMITVPSSFDLAWVCNGFASAHRSPVARSALARTSLMIARVSPAFGDLADLCPVIDESNHCANGAWHTSSVICDLIWMPSEIESSPGFDDCEGLLRQGHTR